MTYVEDDMKPILGILDKGAQALRELRDREASEFAERKRFDDAEWAKLWIGFRLGVTVHLPQEIEPYIDWREAEFRDASRDNAGTYSLFHHLRAKEITVRCPGCMPVKLAYHHSEVEGGWYCMGIHAPIWLELEKTASQWHRVENIFLALAMARETFLAQAEHDATHPL